MQVPVSAFGKDKCVAAALGVRGRQGSPEVAQVGLCLWALRLQMQATVDGQNMSTKMHLCLGRELGKRDVMSSIPCTICAEHKQCFSLSFPPNRNK